MESHMPIRFLRFPALQKEKGIPFSRTHIDRLERAGKFPKRVRLSGMTVAWLEQEIDDHLAVKMSEREDG
jgi:prophage regulatory protein